jgi:hypothetical protein
LRVGSSPSLEAASLGGAMRSRVLDVDRRKVESTNCFREAIKPLDPVTSMIHIRVTAADLQGPYMQTQLFRHGPIVCCLFKWVTSK